MKSNHADVAVSSLYSHNDIFEMYKSLRQNNHLTAVKNTECTQTTLCRGLDSSDNSINNNNAVMRRMADSLGKRLEDPNTPEWERKEIYRQYNDIKQMLYQNNREHEEFIKHETNKQLAIGIIDILGDALDLAVVYGVTSAVTYSFCGDSTQSSSQII